MSLTSQQQSILDHVESNTGLTLVNSIAGSGKTTLLTSIASSLPNSNSLYLAYNSAIASSSKSKFPSSVDCRTVHSLAYQATVKPFKLNVGFLNASHISEKLKYDDKLEFIHEFRAFCLSDATSIDSYFSDHSDLLHSMAKKYFNAMYQGKMDATHDFYLKLYHLLILDGTIEYEPFDLLLWDEIQDMAPVAASIFELLPATRKIGVGDPFQAIYSFNHTVNYFKQAPLDSTTFNMTQSFRVPSYIAEPLQSFCQTYMDPTMQFIGTDSSSSTITTRAFISRTNSSLIDKMIELNDLNIPYTLVRKPEEIFKIPRILASLKPNSFIPNPEFRYLQADYDEWFSSPDLRDKYKSPIAYISYLYGEHDLQLRQACRLLLRHGVSTIMSTYQSAKSHVGAKTNYTLCTGHSSKGLEFHEVTLADDMNDSIEDLVTTIKVIGYIPELDTSETESLNLYYVACSRALVSLNNAKHIKGL